MKLTTIIETEYESLYQTSKESDLFHNSANKKNVKNLVDLFYTWKKLHIHTISTSLVSHNAACHYGIEMAEKLTYTKEDITQVCFEIDPFKITNGQFLFSLFLGEIIQAHYAKIKEIVPYKKNEPYKIVTTQFDELLDSFGYKNSGPTIEVFGNLGDNTANQMESGKIIIHGDTKDLTGFGMTGGSIIVEGDTRAFTGCEMHKGFIHVKGSTREFMGSSMTSGVIKIDGAIGAIKNVYDAQSPEEYARYFKYEKEKKGKKAVIIHQGKKVFEK